VIEQAIAKSTHNECRGTIRVAEQAPVHL
jgi:hypothetical protein